MSNAPECPKCGATSGDDWTQCNGECPMPCSPHYKPAKNLGTVPKSPLNPSFHAGRLIWINHAEPTKRRCAMTPYCPEELIRRRPTWACNLVRNIDFLQVELKVLAAMNARPPSVFQTVVKLTDRQKILWRQTYQDGARCGLDTLGRWEAALPQCRTWARIEFGPNALGSTHHNEAMRRLYVGTI
jgi:hypothetical protein